MPGHPKRLWYYERAEFFHPMYDEVKRGGNYADPAERVRSSHRNKARADFVSGRFGLRLLARATLPTAVERKTWGQLKGIASESPD